MSVGHVNRDDYLQVDRRKEVKDFNRLIEASLDNANFIDDGEGELDNLHLQNIDDDLNSQYDAKMTKLRQTQSTGTWIPTAAGDGKQLKFTGASRFGSTAPPQTQVK